MREPVKLTERSAAIARNTILTLSIGSLIAVFQPVSHGLFQIGCATAIISAITFNMMPFLTAGRTWRSMRQPALTILIVLAALIGFAVLSAWGYVLYLQSK
jgi:hypothetical protein